MQRKKEKRNADDDADDNELPGRNKKETDKRDEALLTIKLMRCIMLWAKKGKKALIRDNEAASQAFFSCLYFLGRFCDDSVQRGLDAA